MTRTGSAQGFTLIELIVAIVLIGILSAVTFSRFLRSDTFNASINRDQIISSVRAAQQKVIGRSDVSLTLQPEGGQLQLIVEQDNTEVQRSSAPLDGVSLSGDVNILDSCANTSGAYAITASNPMLLEFDSLGDLRRGGVQGGDYPGPVVTGLRICVNNNPQYSVCVSKAGYAYAGDCVD